jgi:hypothetical protein
VEATTKHTPTQHIHSSHLRLLEHHLQWDAEVTTSQQQPKQANRRPQQPKSQRPHRQHGPRWLQLRRASPTCWLLYQNPTYHPPLIQNLISFQHDKIPGHHIGDNATITTSQPATTTQDAPQKTRRKMARRQPQPIPLKSYFSSLHLYY